MHTEHKLKTNEFRHVKQFAEWIQHKQIFNYIDSNICHGISLKKPSGNVGTRTCVAGIRSQQKCYALDHHTWG